MRKILAVVVILAVCSVCEAEGGFVDFPTVGMCTGDYVRYRAKPNTNAEIRGRMYTGEKVIVDGMTSVNGETWYEILPPNAQDSAFISGKYMTPYYDEDMQKSPAGRLIVEVLQTYAPREDYDYYNEYDDSPEVKRKYRDGWLARVEAWNPGSYFGEIEIGDRVSKLNQILGEPDSSSKSQYRYSAGDYATFTFKIEDGKITRMIYEED